jgi:surface protein
MNNMFSKCESLTSIDLSNFIIEKISKILFIFNGCISLKQINLSNLSLKDEKYTDLIFLNVSNDCKIICKDKQGLKEEIINNNNLNNTNSIIGQFKGKKYEKLREIISIEEIKGIKPLSINSKKNNFLFYYSPIIGRR